MLPEKEIRCRYQFAQELARIGRKVALHHFRKKNLRVDRKEDKSLVTAGDYAVQKTLFGAIRKAFPGDGTLGEENGENTSNQDGFTWVLDPIDGTNNYGVGMPLFCIAIGLLHRARPVVGVVDVPMIGDTYRAQKGKGAFLNNRRIRTVKGPAVPGDQVGLQAPLSEKMSRLLGHWHRMYRVRNLGSAALHYCMVAAGYFQAAVEYNNYLWDFSGATTIVREAGGIICGFDGKDPFPLNLATLGRSPHGIIATTPRFKNCILKDLQKK